jgi:hypothetical protein
LYCSRAVNGVEDGDGDGEGDGVVSADADGVARLNKRMLRVRPATSRNFMAT